MTPNVELKYPNIGPEESKKSSGLGPGGGFLAQPCSLSCRLVLTTTGHSLWADVSYQHRAIN